MLRLDADHGEMPEPPGAPEDLECFADRHTEFVVRQTGRDVGWDFASMSG
jgi:hypothetical protein